MKKRQPGIASTRETSPGNRVERYRPARVDRDKPVRDFEQFLVDHPDCGFMTALEIKPEGSKFHDFFKLLVLPDGSQNPTLAWKARKCGITLRELMELMNEGQNLLGTLRITNHVPTIMEQQAEAALAKELLCGDCKGTKTKIVQKDGKEEVEEIPCPSCNGSGSIRALGNDKAIDRTLEMAGVLTKGGGFNLNVSQKTEVNGSGVQPVETVVSGIGRIFDVEPE